jgi:hypothetical protein
MPEQQPALAPNAVVRILYDYVATERGVLSLLQATSELPRPRND